MVIYLQIENHNNKYDYLNSNQFGFKKKSGTEIALLYMLNEIISNIENKKIVFTVFLDFKKAFDSINHVNLVNKLQTNFNF